MYSFTIILIYIYIHMRVWCACYSFKVSKNNEWTHKKYDKQKCCKSARRLKRFKQRTLACRTTRSVSWSSSVIRTAVGYWAAGIPRANLVGVDCLTQRPTYAANLHIERIWNIKGRAWVWVSRRTDRPTKSTSNKVAIHGCEHHCNSWNSLT